MQVGAELPIDGKTALSSLVWQRYGQWQLTASSHLAPVGHAALKDCSLNQASVQALLMRYSRTTDIIVGTPLANRTHSELEGLIGYFVNTVALRTDLSGACPAGACPCKGILDSHHGSACRQSESYVQ